MGLDIFISSEFRDNIEILSNCISVKILQLSVALLENCNFLTPIFLTPTF